MKNSRNVKRKVLLSSSAAVLLGLISANPQLVKADSVPTNQAASKEDTTTNETPSEEVISEPTSTTDPAVNQAAVAAQNSDANASKKRIDGTVAGLQVSYDLDTDELTILGGTYANIISYDEWISNQSLSDSEGNSVKLRNAMQIVITGKINLNSSNNANYLFAGFYNASKIVGLENLNFSQATSTACMFSGCEDLTSLDLSNFNTANVTNMDYMFEKCSSLTSIDFSNFNTANVASMEFMFDECSSLTSLNLSSFNTANVTTMEYMFNECTSLTSLNLSSFNTANVTDMRYMFNECTSLISLDLSSFDTASVNNMVKMFYGCSSLTSLNVSNFDTANVTNMESMFEKCSSLPSLDLSSFSLLKVTNMGSMFADDEKLVDLNISSLKTTSLIDLDSTFKNCASLVELNLENFHIRASYRTDITDAFYGCTSLRKLNIKNIIPNASEYGDMLGNLPSLNTLVLGEYTDLSTILYSGYIDDVGLDTEGIWLNVGNGTTIRPEGTEQYTSEQLMAARAITMVGKQRNFTKAETYVRMGKPITIHHVDESGKQIAKDTIFPGNFGDPYSIIGDSVAGYTLKVGQSPVTGIYDNDDTKEREFTFVYIKNPGTSNPGTSNPGTSNPGTSNPGTSNPGTSNPIKGEDVIVHYQDEKGKTIAPSEILSGNIGDGYVSTAKDIAGYTLKTRPKNAKGFFSGTKQNVTYVYSKTTSKTEGETAGNGKGKGNGNKGNGNKGNGNKGNGNKGNGNKGNGNKGNGNKGNGNKGNGNKGNGNKGNGNKGNGSKDNRVNSATLSNSGRYGNRTNTVGSDNDSLNSANYSIDNQQLPKTGSEKKSRLTAIALGSITLTNALALLWTKIKKFSK
ncbi:BspA family leucine-rich repeat surface protein [Lactobacillus apis]|uniref:BspA family leucine-rich repeat surface protein n=1 Tax=Lactobacillus apis TaxID=303541 RepID=UPI00274278ED|nr:BspA family leucine-rich repeat surface protein [Lactobacillus apis]WLS84828.1 BspA family leucine-rich repeat surface protein [Lactobacillus apis]